MEARIISGQVTSSVLFFYKTELKFLDSPNPSEDIRKLENVITGEIYYDEAEGGYQVLIKFANDLTLEEMWATINSAIKILIEHEERAERLMRFIRANKLAQ